MASLRVQVPPQRRRGAGDGEPLATGDSVDAVEQRERARAPRSSRSPARRSSRAVAISPDEGLTRSRENRVRAGARPSELETALRQALGLVVAVERQPGAAEGGVELGGDARLVGELGLDPRGAVGEERRRRGVAAGTEVGIEAAEDRGQEVAHPRRALALDRAWRAPARARRPHRRRATARRAAPPPPRRDAG